MRFVALAVGFIAERSDAQPSSRSSGSDMSEASEFIGKVSIQAVPGSIGAMFAQSELGGKEGKKEEKRRHAGYAGEIFIMAAGALFLAFNVAPTEEMILIAHQMSIWQSIALVVVSLLIYVHLSIRSSFWEARRSRREPPGADLRALYGRGLCYCIADERLHALDLWSNRRLADRQAISPLIVLGFPSAVGAAAARLIL